MKRVADAKLEKEREAFTKKAKLVARIQSLVRGVLGRIKHKKDLPLLKKAHKLRSYCCECDNVVAVRRCRQCKDKFCASCYDKIHSKGKMSLHFFLVAICNAILYNFFSISFTKN
jgi:hypothetical protein